MSESSPCKEFIVSVDEVEKRFNALKSAIKEKKTQPDLEQIKIENSACKLTLRQIQDHLYVARESYISFNLAGLLNSSKRLQDAGVNWLDELHGYLALGVAGTTFHDDPMHNTVVASAIEGMNRAPLEPSSYIALATLKLIHVQPFQAFYWLDLASQCPNPPYNILVPLYDCCSLMKKALQLQFASLQRHLLKMSPEFEILRAEAPESVQSILKSIPDGELSVEAAYEKSCLFQDFVGKFQTELGRFEIFEPDVQNDASNLSLFSLSPVLARKIMGYLPVESMIALANTCPRGVLWARDDDAWKEKMQVFGDTDDNLLKSSKTWFNVYRRFIVSCRIMRFVYETDIIDSKDWCRMEEQWLSHCEHDFHLIANFFPFPLSLNFLLSSGVSQIAGITNPKVKPFQDLLGCDLPTFVVRFVWQKDRLLQPGLVQQVAIVHLADLISRPGPIATEIWHKLQLEHQVLELCQFYNSFHSQYSFEIARLDMILRIRPQLNFEHIYKPPPRTSSSRSEEKRAQLWHIFICKTETFHMMHLIDRGYLYIEFQDGTDQTNGFGFFSHLGEVKCTSSFGQPNSPCLTSSSLPEWSFTLSNRGMQDQFIGGCVICTNTVTNEKQAGGRFIAFRDARTVTPDIIDTTLQEISKITPFEYHIQAITNSLPALPREDAIIRTIIRIANDMYTEMLSLFRTAYRASHWSFETSDWLFETLDLLKRKGFATDVNVIFATPQGPLESNTLYFVRSKVQTIAYHQGALIQSHLLVSKKPWLDSAIQTLRLHSEFLRNPLGLFSSQQAFDERQTVSRIANEELIRWRSQLLLWESPYTLGSGPSYTPSTPSQLLQWFNDRVVIVEEDLAKIIATCNETKTVTMDPGLLAPQKSPERSNRNYLYFIAMGSLALAGAFGGVFAWRKWSKSKKQVQ